MPKPGKFGYYQSEKPTFRSLANEIGLIEKEDGIFTKHPLAFIAEAADDIAYLTSDIEDAHKFGMISYDKAYDILIKAARTIGSFQENLLGTISEEENKIKFLRSAASIAMIKSCSEVFVAHEVALLEGNVSKSFIELSDDLAATEIEMRNVCNEYIYFHPKKVKSEAGAYEIIGNLLFVFSEAIEESLSKNGKDLSARSKNLLKMFDPDEKTQKTTNSYDSYLRLVDYISGMTDRYALDVHETLSGRKLSNGF